MNFTVYSYGCVRCGAVRRSFLSAQKAIYKAYPNAVIETCNLKYDRRRRENYEASLLQLGVTDSSLPPIVIFGNQAILLRNITSTWLEALSLD